VLDVVVGRAGLVAGDEGRERAGAVDPVEDGEREQQQADDDGGQDERGTLGH
jgi:hypothetical protein